MKYECSTTNAILVTISSNFMQYGISTINRKGNTSFLNVLFIIDINICNKIWNMNAQPRMLFLSQYNYKLWIHETFLTLLQINSTHPGNHITDVLVIILLPCQRYRFITYIITFTQVFIFLFRYNITPLKLQWNDPASWMWPHLHSQFIQWIGWCYGDVQWSTGLWLYQLQLQGGLTMMVLIFYSESNFHLTRTSNCDKNIF